MPVLRISKRASCPYSIFKDGYNALHISKTGKVPVLQIPKRAGCPCSQRQGTPIGVPCLLWTYKGIGVCGSDERMDPYMMFDYRPH